MGNGLDKICREKQTHLLWSVTFFRKLFRLWDMKRYFWPRQATDDNIIRRMRFACRITKAIRIFSLLFFIWNILELIYVLYSKTPSSFQALGRSHSGRNVGWACLRMGCWGGYLSPGGTRWQVSGEYYITGSFVTCTLHQILFGWSNQEEWGRTDGHYKTNRHFR